MKKRVSTTPGANLMAMLVMFCSFAFHYTFAKALPAFDSMGRCQISKLEINASALQQEAQSFTKQQEEKVRRLQTTLAAAPNNIAVRSELANVLTTLARYPEAASQFAHLLSSTLSLSQRAAVLNNYGNFYFLQDSLAQAETYYLQAAQADSLDKKTYLNLGTLYSAVNDDSLAVAAYSHFITEDAQIALAETLLGLTPGEDDSIRAGGESRRMNTSNLKKKAGNNIRKPSKKTPGKKARPFGKKAITTGHTIGVANYSDLESVLFWAEAR